MLKGSHGTPSAGKVAGPWVPVAALWKGNRRVVAWAARGCDLGAVITGPKGQSSTYPRGSLCLFDLRAFSLRPTRQMEEARLSKTVWGLRPHPRSCANEKKGRQDSWRVWRPARPPIRLGGASSRRGLRRLPKPGCLPATLGRVPARGHCSGLVNLSTVPHPVLGPSEWRWGTLV